MSARNFVPGGQRPIYPEDYLVEVWRFQSVGRDEDARALLCGIWSWAMDIGASPQHVRVALRLLNRLAFVTDSPQAWRDLPNELVVYRAESSPEGGLCWTLDPEVAKMHAESHGLSVTVGRVAKGDVLAYITHRGEAEIVVQREHVSPSSFPISAERKPPISL